MILIYHIQKDFSERKWYINSDFSFFDKGFIGVEFFFLVSGFLAAMEIFETRDNAGDLGKDTLSFVWRKVKPILPYHIFLVILTLVLKPIFFNKDFLTLFVKGFSSIFFLQMSGFPSTPLIYVEWYISAMLMTFVLLYPLAKKYYHIYVRALAPVISFIILGMLISVNGTFGKERLLYGPITSGIWRAFAEISMGMFLFEALRLLRLNWNPNKFYRVLFTISELGLYGLIVFFAMTRNFKRVDMGFVAVAMSLAVFLSFSGFSLGESLFNNKFSFFLGKITLPIYLCQNIVRSFFVKYGNHLPGKKLILLDLFCIISFGVLLYFIWEFIKKTYSKQKMRRKEK